MLNHKPQALFILLTRLFMISCFVPMIYAQQTGSDNSQTKPAALGAITGRVVNESGQPLLGASVYIGAIGSSGRRTTATDNEGNFKIQDLDAGIYRIYLSSPGYVSEPAEPGLNTSPTYRPGDSVSLTLIKGGVIAGTVTNGAGEPVVNASVRASRIRDVEGKQLQTASQSRERLTDDRGYYRIYGLQPGSYVISAGGAGAGQYFGFGANPYANDAPTYAPASTRDTAAEIIVQSGQEAIADIRYRGEAGHSISGRVTGVQPPLLYSSGVRLVDVESRATIAATGAPGDDRTFQLNGVSDGNYEISAIGGGGPNTDLAFSAARRITVKGSDVTGIELALAPLASITGRVNIEADPKLNCGRHRETALRETLISVRRDRVQDKTETKNSKDKSDQAVESAFLPTFSEAIANDKAEINLRNLPSGIYRVEARLPGSGWYVRALSFGAADQRPAANRALEANVARDGIALKSGDKLTGFTVTITEGGAALRGRISIPESQRLPQNIRVYLIPADRESADNVLKFFEASAEADGSFAIGNIAPGRYWIVLRAAGENDSNLKPISQDSALRAKVLHGAESLKREISFKPCERISDFDLSYAPAAVPRQ